MGEAAEEVSLNDLSRICRRWPSQERITVLCGRGQPRGRAGEPPPGRVSENVFFYRFRESELKPGAGSRRKPLPQNAFSDKLVGEADRLQIWSPAEGGYRLVEERLTPPRGMGEERWRILASSLHDCRALLANAAGENPRRILEREGLPVVVMEGLIVDGLDAVYRGVSTSPWARRRPGAGCGGPMKGRSCGGDGLGCG